MVQLNKLKLLENNPRKITSKNKRVLKESIEKNIKFLEFKPILVDENDEIIAGNQRYIVLQKMGYKEVPDEWVMRCIGLTEAERKDLIVIDNVNLGQFTTDIFDFIDKEKLYDFNIKIKDDWNAFTNKIEDIDVNIDVMFPIYIECEEELFNKWKELKKQNKLNDTELLELLIDKYEK
jgi:hypothetical protein